mmetsp:Transcript_20137/g.22450  ORF Transcript_20137/g.22450 Transcript_20137/m.22450 type:complete len:219 (+) Transcript_20137:163-819(+)
MCRRGSHNPRLTLTKTHIFWSIRMKIPCAVETKTMILVNDDDKTSGGRNVEDVITEKQQPLPSSVSVTSLLADKEEEEEEEKNADGEYTEPYQVEQIAAILSVTCIFLSALYTIFAVLLFLCHAGEEQSILRIEQGRGGVGIGTHLNHSRLLNNHHQSGMNRGHLETVDVSHMGASGKTTPLVVSNVVNDVGQVQTSTLVNSAEGFITIENSSQGTSD